MATSELKLQLGESVLIKAVALDRTVAPSSLIRSDGMSDLRAYAAEVADDASLLQSSNPDDTDVFDGRFGKRTVGLVNTLRSEGALLSEVRAGVVEVFGSARERSLPQRVILDRVDALLEYMRGL